MFKQMWASDGTRDNHGMQRSNRVRIDETFARTFSQYSVMGCAAATASAVHNADSNTQQTSDSEEEKENTEAEPAKTDFRSEAVRACSIHITGLNMPIETDIIKEVFTQSFGDVAEVSLPMLHQYKYYHAGREAVDKPRTRYGFVQFVSPDSKIKALASELPVLVGGVEVAINDIKPPKEQERSNPLVDALTANNERKLYFQGKGITIDTQVLEKEFGKYGTVESIHFPRLDDYQQVERKYLPHEITQNRYGFVTFSTEEEANNALEAGSVMDSQIKFSAPNSKTSRPQERPQQYNLNRNNKVYIHCEGMTTDPALLGKLFSTFGRVTQLEIPHLQRYQEVDEKNYEVIRQPRFAFITFADALSATKAVRQGGIMLGEKIIHIKKAQEPRTNFRDRKESQASSDGSEAESVESVDSGIESIVDENNNNAIATAADGTTVVAEAK